MSRYMKGFKYFLYMIFLSSLMLGTPLLAEEIDMSSQRRTASSSSSSSFSNNGSDSQPLYPVPQSYAFTGAATYRIPIEVPPGRNGLTPKVSLVYNSYCKNGWVGVGWNLDMGSIQRSSKRGVNFGKDDYVAVLDGAASELVARSDWGSGYFGAKVEEGFSKYYKNPSGGWIVTHRDGTRYFYGTTSESRQAKGDGIYIFKWYLDKVEDTNGNYLTISYFNEWGEIYLKEINYTGNSGLAPTNIIRFITEDRSDTPSMYQNGQEVKTTFRLKEIHVIGNREFARRYVFEYENSQTTGQTRLIRLKECGSDEVCLPAKEFTWTNRNTVIFNQLDLSFQGYNQGINFNADQKNIIPGDFNGDGRTDLFLQGNGNDLSSAVFLADDSGKFYMFQNLGTNWYSNNHNVITGDFNGDGRTDLFLHSKSSDGSNYVILANSDGTFGDPIQTTPSHYTYSGRLIFSNGSVTLETDKYIIFAGDFNGDGRTDLFFQSNNDIYDPNDPLAFIFSFIIYADSDGRFTTINNFIPSWAGVQKAILGDFNGDGETDIFLQMSDTTLIWPNTGTVRIEAFPKEHRICYSGNYGGTTFTDGYLNITWNSKVCNIIAGDFNGDGKTDLFLQKIDSSNSSHVILADGDGKFSSVYQTLNSQDLGIDWSTSAHHIISGDFNGDGKTDLFLQGCQSNQTNYICVVNANGQITKIDQSFSNPDSYSMYWDQNSHNAIIGDYNGDGRQDFFFQGKTSGDIHHLWHSNSGYPFSDLLGTIKNGLGGIITMTYCNSSYNNNKLPFILHPLDQIQVNDGFNNISTTRYNYSNGIFDFLSRDFRGFGLVEQTNPDNTRVKTCFNQDEFFKGRPYKIENISSTGNCLGKTEFTWNREDITFECKFVNLSQKRTEFYDEKSVFSQENYSYDSSNHLLSSVEISGTDAPNIIKIYTYNNLGDWLWRLTNESILENSNKKLRDTIYEYYQDGTGNLRYKKSWLDNPSSYITTEISYDSYGNIKSQTDAKGNTTYTDYEYTNTFPSVIANPQTEGISHTVSNEAYSYGFGKLIIQKDENGNYTHYAYDVFGRLKQIDYPDGGQKIIDYYDSQFPRLVVSRVKENQNSFINTFEYFDGIGRKVETITSGENGKSIVSKIHYDVMGRVVLEEGAFFGNGTDYNQNLPEQYPWKRLSFDDFGRIKLIENKDGTNGISQTSYAYSGFRTTITDPDGGKKAEKKDHLGRIIQVIEYTEKGSQTTTYEYNKASDLISIINSLGISTIIHYDSLGRKICLEDPDLGNWEYSYDSNGNLLTQTDEKNQMTTFSYDELNRVKVKTTPDSVVYYTYDRSQNGTGKLYRISRSGSNSVIETVYQAYDSMGREKTVQKNIFNDIKSFKYNYDYTGKLSSLIYPDNFEVSYSYYPGSDLINEVKGLDGLTYSRYSNYEPTGKIKQISYGNNTETNYTYDPWSGKLTSIVTKNAAGQSVNNISYVYTKAFDIAEIVDQIKGITYHYGYDSLHRLISETNNNPNESYEPSVIEFFYDNNVQSHSASSVKINDKTTYNYVYDGNGNMTNGVDLTNLSQINSRIIEYNADNMPTTINHGIAGTIDIQYDGEGERVQKSGNENTILYYNDYFELENGSPVKYIFAGEKRIAKISSAGTFYYHGDHLGSTSVVTDQNGNKVESTSYLPFGGEREHSGGNVSAYKFTGQEMDAETGLYNYGARLYDPVMGRFISPDSVAQNVYDPQALNPYAYCRNNPLVYTDPSGHIWTPWDMIDLGSFVQSTLNFLMRPTLSNFGFFVWDTISLAPIIPSSGTLKLANEGVHIVQDAFFTANRVDNLAADASKVGNEIHLIGGKVEIIDVPQNYSATKNGITDLVPKGTVPLGKWGETRLSQVLGGAGSKPTNPFTTSLGNRYVDRLVNGIAHEAKAGVNVKLTKSIEKQILKDAELVATQQIKGAHWHFFQGASDDVLGALTKRGIKYTVH